MTTGTLLEEQMFHNKRHPRACVYRPILPVHSLSEPREDREGINSNSNSPVTVKS